jgi:glucosamine-6-phosphate deaminase
VPPRRHTERGTQLIDQARFFGNDLSQVPTHALTMGLGTISEAAEIVLLVTGSKKAGALQRSIEGGVNHMVRCVAKVTY